MRSRHIQNPLKYEAQVSDRGTVELHLPYAAGSRVVCFVIPELADILGDLPAAAQSSMAFWDNPLDDEEWNNA